VVLEHSVIEPQERSCIALEAAPSEKTGAALAPLTGTLSEVLEGLLGGSGEFATRAGEKMRKQGSFAGQDPSSAHSTDGGE